MLKDSNTNNKKQKAIDSLELQKHTLALHKQKVIDAMSKSLGIVSISIKKADISRSTFYRWIREDEEFKAAIMDIEEDQCDFVEAKLLKLIQDENPASVQFYLKTKGKKRGYIERIENTGADGKELNLTPTVIILPSNNRGDENVENDEAERD